MPYDDELRLSTSHAEHFTRADKGQLKDLEMRLKQEGKEVAAKPLTQEKSKLKLTVLKQQMENGKKDEEKKRKEREKEKANRRSFTTKTREQEIAQSRITGSEQPTSQSMIEQGKLATAAEDTRKKEGEVQDEDRT